MWSNVISDPIMPHFIIKRVEIWIVVSFYWKVWHLFWVLQFINLCQNYVTWNDFEKNWFEKSSLKPLYQYNPNHAERFSSSLSKGYYPSSIYVIGRISCNFVIPTLCHVLDFVCDNDIIFRKRHSFHLLLKYLHS